MVDFPVWVEVGFACVLCMHTLLLCPPPLPPSAAGPPGTGKTSLCQALAQKLTIRLADK